MQTDRVSVICCVVQYSNIVKISLTRILRQIGTRLLLMRDPDSRTVIVCCTNYGKESLHRNQCYMLLDVVHGLSHWRSGNVGHIEMGYKYAAVSRWTQ